MDADARLDELIRGLNLQPLPGESGLLAEGYESALEVHLKKNTAPAKNWIKQRGLCTIPP